jgi:hypothetical protein
MKHGTSPLSPSQVGPHSCSPGARVSTLVLAVAAQLKRLTLLALLTAALAPSSHASPVQLTHFAMGWAFCDENGTVTSQTSQGSYCVGDTVYMINLSKHGKLPNGDNGAFPIGNSLTGGRYSFRHFPSNFQIFPDVDAADWLGGEVISHTITSPLANTNWSINFEVHYWASGGSSGTTATVSPGSSVYAHRTLYYEATPVPNVSITPSASTICPGDSVTLTATGGASWQWSTGATSNSITVTPTATTTFEVIGTNGMCSKLVTATVNVIGPPDFDLGPDIFLCDNEPFPTLDPNFPGAVSYLWSKVGGGGLVLSLAPTFTPGSVGTYTVTIVGDCGLVSSDSITIDYDPKLSEYSPAFDIQISAFANGTSEVVATMQPPPAGWGFSWNVCPIDDIGGTVIGSCSGNNSAWWAPQFLSELNFPGWEFEQDNYYRISRGVWTYDGCVAPYETSVDIFVPDVPMITWVSFTENSAMRAFNPSDINAAGNGGDETDLAWGDLDRNGWDDLVVVRKQPFTSSGKRTNILLMNVVGTLTDQTNAFATCSDVVGDNGFNTATNDRDVKLSDVDGDGWLDVVTATTLSDGDPKWLSHPRIYMNQGEDANGDWLGLCYEEARIPQIFTMDGGGNPLNPVAPRFCSVAVGDVTGDGMPDIYFGDHDSSGAGGGGQPGGLDVNNRLFVNDGNGFFTDSHQTRMGANHLLSAFGAASLIADMNGDGVNDVLKQTALNPPQHVAISYNDPANEGFFNIYDNIANSEPYHVDAGDLNNDGRLDIVLSSDNADRYLMNDGNDALGRAQWSAAQTFEYEVGGDLGFASNNLIADLDMDGWNDVLIADVDVDTGGFNRRMHIFHNRGPGSGAGGILKPKEEGGGGWTGVTGMTTNDLSGTHDVAVFDVDNDGANDMVISRNGGTFTWESGVDVTTCQEDRGFGGPGPEALQVCGTPLGTGGSAQLVLAGAEPFALAILLIGVSDSQLYNPALELSTLVPVIFKLQFTNGAGIRQFPIAGGSGENGVAEVYLQYLTTNFTTGSSKGYGASNIIRIELEE